MMNTIEILKQARELISDQDKWTTGCCARNRSGESVNPTSDQAVRWCAFGAIVRVNGGFSAGKFNFVKVAAKELSEGKITRISKFNDESDHQDVLKMFDLAIEKASKETASA